MIYILLLSLIFFALPSLEASMSTLPRSTRPCACQVLNPVNDSHPIFIGDCLDDPLQKIKLSIKERIEHTTSAADITKIREHKVALRAKVQHFLYFTTSLDLLDYYAQKCNPGSLDLYAVDIAKSIILQKRELPKMKNNESYSDYVIRLRTQKMKKTDDNLIDAELNRHIMPPIFD